MIPHQDFLPSHKVSVEDEILINEELGELIQKQAIHLVSEHDYNTGFVSSLFVIPKKEGGQRPVFNLRLLNQFIKYEHFKMEGIYMLRDLDPVISPPGSFATDQETISPPRNHPIN